MVRGGSGTIWVRRKSVDVWVCAGVGVGNRESGWIFESTRPVGNIKGLSKQGSSPPEKQKGIAQGVT